MATINLRELTRNTNPADLKAVALLLADVAIKTSRPARAALLIDLSRVLTDEGERRRVLELDVVAGEA